MLFKIFDFSCAVSTAPVNNSMEANATPLFSPVLYVLSDDSQTGVNGGDILSFF